MSPQHVKPYVKGNKNDSHDAEGICEAVTRPSMRFVGAKTIEQQDILLIHRVRALRIKTRTALVNQTRGLLAEYGIVLPKRVENLRKHLVKVIAEGAQLSDRAREQFHGLYEELLLLDDQIQKVEQSLMGVFNSCEVCKRLATLPGIGPITATALVGTLFVPTVLIRLPYAQMAFPPLALQAASLTTTVISPTTNHEL
jgi:transposase